MQRIKYISFGLLGLITLSLAAATIVEKYDGTATAMRYFYHSPWMVALWVVMAITAIIYIVRRRMSMHWSTIMLHLAFLVILIGAAVSMITGVNGTVHLTADGGPVEAFAVDDGSEYPLPFSIGLSDVDIQYHAGTASASDYVSHVVVTLHGQATSHTISMNHILDIEGYRFYQTSMSDTSSTLTVSYDPWGIGVTYAGYALLLAAIVAFVVHSRRRLAMLLRRAMVVVFLLTCAGMAHAQTADTPPVLQRPLANNFGKMYAYWNGRVVPLQTVARDFCIKVYGSDSYHGLTAEQVLTGWLFYYDSWKRTPFINVKNQQVRQQLGIDEKYAALIDFYGRDGYRLSSMLDNGATQRIALDVDDRVALVTRVCTGSAIAIIPEQLADGHVVWHSWADKFSDLGAGQEIATYIQQMSRCIAHGRYNEANSYITRIREAQSALAGKENLPTATAFGAERLFNSMPGLLWPAILILILGVVAMFVTLPVWLRFTVTGAVFGYITFILVLQWIIGGHVPMSSGYETMEVMSWLSAVGALFAVKRLPTLASLAAIVTALAMFVALMGESNPSITPLIPVLSSPLLSIHVLMVMISYALFAVMMLNAVNAYFHRHDKQSCERLSALSTALLYPAVFSLAIGIFIGAVWANQSWGRYWGWDPKETWALITLIVYCFPLHSASFPAFGCSRVLHTYLFCAFVTVFITYFGVNFLLSGLHSYAV